MIYLYLALLIGYLVFATFGFLAGVYLRWKDGEATKVPQAFYDAFGEGGTL